MRAVITCRKRGLFLGTYGNIAVFANVEDYGAYKAPTFKDRHVAEAYAVDHLAGDVTEDADCKLEYIEIDTKLDYVSCVELIKLGYHKPCGQMMTNLPNASDTMH